MLISGAFGYPADYLLFWLLFLSLIVHTWCFFRFFPWSRRRRSGLVLGNFLIFLCLAGVGFLIGESYERFAAVRTDGFGVSLPARRWFVLHTQLNSGGFRDVEWTVLKPPGVRRIAFLGDSYTYGWGVERVADRFTDRLQARFAARSEAVEVLNVAKPGWGTGDHLQQLPELLDRYAVVEVVLAYVLNDIEKLMERPEDLDPTRPPEPKWFNPDTSCFLDFLWRRLWLPRMPSVRGYGSWLVGGYADPAVWTEQRERLRELHRRCVERGVDFRVVLLPGVREAGMGLDGDKLRVQVSNALREDGVEVLDATPALRGVAEGELTVNAGDAHPNARAHALWAEHIWSAWYAPR